MPVSCPACGVLQNVGTGATLALLAKYDFPLRRLQASRAHGYPRTSGRETRNPQKVPSGSQQEEPERGKHGSGKTGELLQGIFPLTVCGVRGYNQKNNGSGKMYTIKEAAGILGMTKPGIRYRITALEIPLNKDAFGRIMLSDDDLQWIREGKKPEREPESGENKEKEPERKAENTEKEPEETGKNQKEPESGVTAALVEMLREELRVKNAQIKSLTAQLSDTTEALKSAQRSLEQAQILHAKSVNLLPDAQTEPEPEDEQESETRTRAEEDPTPQKRGLWARIFGR